MRPEVLAEFDELIAAHGVRYRAQACGVPNAHGLWEAWIEFVSTEGGSPIRSPRETTQPNRTDAAYWASGLSATYLEGALNRALNPIVRKLVAPSVPLFDQPAPPFATATEHSDRPNGRSRRIRRAVASPES